MFNKIKFIEQMEHSECGLACLAMILSYHKHKISLTELRDEFGLPKSGGSFFQLTSILKEKGMNVNGYRVDASNLKNLEAPLILHWKNTHFVILEKITKNHFHIIDPAFGHKKINKMEFENDYSGVCLSATPGKFFSYREEGLSKKFFWDIVIKHKKDILALIGISLLLQITAVSIPVLTRWITDEVLLLGKEDYLLLIGYALFLVFTFNLIVVFLRGHIVTLLQTKMDSFLMSNFINRLFKLPLNFFENRSSGELLYRSNLNNQIRQILSGNSISFFIDIMLIFTYLIIMFSFSVKMAFVVISVGILLLLIIITNTRVLKNYSDKMVTSQGEVQKYLSEHIYGITDVKMSGGEERIYEQWKKKFNIQLRVTEKSGLWNSYIQGLSTTIQFILPLLILWIGGFLVINGEITIGTLIAFNAMAVGFIGPVISLSSSYTELIYLSSFFQKIMDVINSKEERLVGGRKEEIQGKLDLENVSFAHDKFSEPILKNISFSINKGEKVAIVGPSGAGKSTLAKIILGLYQPTEGTVYYDRMSFDEYELSHIRKQIGSVLQESRLFNRTILENILMDKAEFIGNVELALKQSNVDEFVNKQTLGIYTKISEGGANFSGGQRQRLILARALVINPKVLVLDEATSALDNYSESIIDDSVSKLNCTRIIIAHKLNTIKNADRIIVLNDGEVAEIGTHDQLIDAGGIYQRLYNLEKEDSVKKLVKIN